MSEERKPSASLDGRRTGRPKGKQTARARMTAQMRWILTNLDVAEEKDLKGGKAMYLPLWRWVREAPENRAKFMNKVLACEMELRDDEKKPDVVGPVAGLVEQMLAGFEAQNPSGRKRSSKAR